MKPAFESTPNFLPLHTLEGISVVDSQLNHVVSLASLADPAASTSQLNTLESILNFPGLRRAFHYFYDHNTLHGIPATTFGPSVIQLQPGETTASLLYLEKSPNYGFVYNLVFKEYTVKDGIPRFSEENIDCINIAGSEQIRTYFNRVDPTNAVLSTLISLANSIFLIDHEHDEEVMSCLDARIEMMNRQRENNIDNPAGLLLAPYGRTADGHEFGIEPETADGQLTGIWKEDFYELLLNLRVYIPPMLDYLNKRNTFSRTSSFINSSIGPIRLKYKDDHHAEGLFIHIRSNSGKGFEFWLGDVPYEGSRNHPRLFYDKITIKRKELSASEILNRFPTIDSLDILLPLFLRAGQLLKRYHSPQKSIREIITECQRNHPNETRYVMEQLAQEYRCVESEVTQYCPEEEIREALYNSIRVGGESRKVIKQMRSYQQLGSVNGILMPGSREEFDMIKRERIRAVRDAEYRKRVEEVNRRTPVKIAG
ncbi:MAG: hypothetical protein C4527_26495 [Candidatus Omnitrophota bacterium]|jgi:hypothetical protein|nr:MAG: hypothetical protein C4527_26495 [Candidatus Omnitrophota bacterium]